MKWPTVIYDCVCVCAECPSTLGSCEEVVQKLEQMQILLKTEPEDGHNDLVDITSFTPPTRRPKVKEEEQEADPEPKYFLPPCPSTQFISETAQQVWTTWEAPLRFLITFLVFFFFLPAVLCSI